MAEATKPSISTKILEIIKSFCKLTAHGEIIISVRNHEIVGVKTSKSEYQKLK